MKRKINIEKNIRAIIKQEIFDRHESQRRVFEFSRELSNLIDREKLLFSEIGDVQERIRRNKHLIEMYSVMDTHKLLDIWELEKSIGIAENNFPTWKEKFITSKQGFEFKRREENI